MERSGLPLGRLADVCAQHEHDMMGLDEGCDILYLCDEVLRERVAACCVKYQNAFLCLQGPPGYFFRLPAFLVAGY